MSSQNQGRQSPSPEEQTGAQQQDPPSKGTGVNQGGSNEEESQQQLEGLSSNPKGVLEDHVEETTKKTVGEHAK